MVIFYHYSSCSLRNNLRHVQDSCMKRMNLRVAGFGLLWYRFRFTSTRAHGVPFVPLSTPRAHILTAALCGANRCGGNAAPYTPFYPPALISKTHS